VSAAAERILKYTTTPRPLVAPRQRRMRLLLQQAAAVAAAALLSATVLAALVSPTAASGAAALVPCPNNCSAIGTCNEADGTCDCPYEYSWSVDCSQTRLELMDMDAFNIYVRTHTAHGLPALRFSTLTSEHARHTCTACAQRWVVVGFDAAVAALILGLLGTVVIITGKLGRPTVQAGAYFFLLLAFVCAFSAGSLRWVSQQRPDTSTRALGWVGRRPSTRGVLLTGPRRLLPRV